MPESIDLKQVEEQYHHLAAAGEYARALDVAARNFEVFPRHAQRVVYYWRMKMACKLNDAPLALQTLREAVGDGHWYAGLEENEDFEVLHGLPEFHELTALCRQRRAEEMANARPEMKVLVPDGAGPHPLVFALHGNSGNVETFAPHWESARRAGWLVALPQSPQVQGPGTYSWNDWEWATQALEDQYTRVCNDHPVDTDRLVLGGFSMGAGLALWLALERTFSARGLVCVAPFLSDVEALRSELVRPENRGTRIYLVTSQRDEYCLEVAQKLSAILPGYGIEHKLDIYTDLGHAFPPAFEARLPEALDFVLNG